jgi:hypothetical protein
MMYGWVSLIVLAMVWCYYFYENDKKISDFDKCDLKNSKYKQTTVPVEYDEIESIGTHKATINGLGVYDYFHTMNKPSITNNNENQPIYTIEAGKLFNKVVGKVKTEYEDPPYSYGPYISDIIPEYKNTGKDGQLFRMNETEVSDILECRFELEARIDLYDDGTITKIIANKDNNDLETYKISKEELEYVLENIPMLFSGYIESGAPSSSRKYEYVLNIYNEGNHKISFPWSYSMLMSKHTKQEKLLDLLKINDNDRNKNT